MASRTKYRSIAGTVNPPRGIWRAGFQKRDIAGLRNLEQPKLFRSLFLIHCNLYRSHAKSIFENILLRSQPMYLPEVIADGKQGDPDRFEFTMENFRINRTLPCPSSFRRKFSLRFPTMLVPFYISLKISLFFFNIVSLIQFLFHFFFPYHSSINQSNFILFKNFYTLIQVKNGEWTILIFYFR